MFKNDDTNDTMLMIASSAKNQQKKSKAMKLQGDQCEPLQSVNRDLDMFIKKFEDKIFFYIKTSNDCGILLSKQYITKWLAQKFSTANGDVYLFYTGHGHTNGDWAVETAENPGGGRLPFNEISRIWMGNRRSNQSHLYIFMDSCYSGVCCIEAGNITKDRQQQKMPSLNIGVFAACECNQKSKSMVGKGSFFSRCIFQSNQLEQQEIDILFNQQAPCFLNGGTNVEKLKPEHVRMLHESIANVPKIKNSQVQPQNSKEERNRKQQEEIKKIITKSKVDSWASLSTKTQLDLDGCGLTILPDQIGKLTQLVKLRLSDNMLSKVPNILANLSNLQTLDLAQNQLEEVPECIGKLVNLQKLYLNKNRLKELRESAMIGLVGLKCLYINNNQLTVFPMWIDKLQQLEALWMYGNKMEVNQKVVMSMKKLQELYISEYQLQGEQQIQQLENHCKQSNIKLGWF